MAVRHRIDHDHDDAEPPGELGHLFSVGPARHVAIVGTVGRASATLLIVSVPLRRRGQNEPTLNRLSE